MNPDFWHGKRVFLTGHTGFKGAWLSLWLQSLNSVVRGYSMGAPTEPNLFAVAEVGSEMDCVQGDIRDYSRLQESMDGFSPEVVVHMAAQSLVRPSYEDPLLTYSTNVMGTANVLEAARRSKGVRAVAIITSDKCYLNNGVGSHPFAEGSPMGGFDPYSSSKGAAELVTAAYRNSFFAPADYATHGVSVASARAGNVIGGGDWAADRLVPDLIRGFSEGRCVILRNPDAIRPWQYVLEPLSGYLLLLERMFDHGREHSAAWNFGPDPAEERPVSWVADQVVAKWGSGEWEHDSCVQPYEAKTLRLDSSKARCSLGWQPRLTLADALEWTVHWYKGHIEGNDAREMCLRQIQDYQRLEIDQYGSTRNPFMVPDASKGKS